MKKIHKTPFAIAIGASLLPTLGMNAAQAESNPFALTDLGSGYMLTAEAKPDAAADKMKDGSCGEGKCGAAMMKKTPDKTATEGKCAGNKPAASGDKAAEGKKMEGNCGANMK
ncbi:MULTISPECIES: hypothetical protein [Methylomonas]|uniref:Low-complexity protein n=1 Tax=Methylomonas koyamae TaxID=702114 RepID=A0A177NIS1_9GAMM|nr:MULTISPECIES: hypothetical protein [Methylomonas]NJA07263.1 hypothetical protein [Methylococcaceae bacterium WWC4]OAI17484.1 hypothetical protein A1355_07525 [Methylomonas koyamae]OHX34517.1 hypothetical protein BJL95_18425 [Methylomonas sp. LWB]WGS85157.1 hypothetical protein QC632_19230 [Methylomonas sp. UP202]